MDYTQDQIDEILKRAQEVGIHQSARENSVPWQKVQAWAKKAGVEITPKVVKPKKSKKTSTQASESSTPPTTAPTAPPDVGKNEAWKNGAEEKKAEKPKRGRKKKAVYEVVDAAPEEKKAEKQEEKAGAVAASELEIENAVLRKENEQLKAKIEKLQKALADLI